MDAAERNVYPPEYVLQDRKTREEKLSQWGISLPEQRAFFHELCEGWAPFIDCSHFLARAGGQGGLGDLEGLFQKLKEQKIGLILTQKTPENDRRPHKLLLCGEGDARFWYYFVSEALNVATDHPRNPFLTQSLLANLAIPPNQIQPLSPGELTKPLMDEAAESQTLYALELNGESLVCPGRDLGRLVSFAAAKIRYALQNADNLAAVARLLNTSLGDVTNRLNQKDATFWKGLCDTLLRNRGDLSADRRLKLEKGLFLAAELFSQYMATQMEEARRQKEFQKERELDMRAVEDWVRSEADIVPEKELKHRLAQLEGKYEEAFAEFRNDFYKQYTENPGSNGLANLVALHDGWLHRDQVFPQFSRWMQHGSKEVGDELAHRMERILRTSNRAGDLSFSTPEALDNAILTYLKTRLPALAELLVHPKVLAEGIIHHGRVALKTQSVEEVRPLMAPFFKGDTLKLKALGEIFAIDPAALYDQAFRRLNWFSQLFIRLRGQYKLDKERYLKLSPLAVRSAALAASASLGKPAVERPSKRNEGTGGVEPGSGRRNSGGGARANPAATRAARDAAAREAAAEAEARRLYSKKEQDSAWQQFGQNVKKKPGS